MLYCCFCDFLLKLIINVKVLRKCYSHSTLQYALIFIVFPPELQLQSSQQSDALEVQVGAAGCVGWALRTCH